MSEPLIYTRAGLEPKSLEELAEIGKRSHLRLRFNKNHNRQTRITRILKRQTELAVTSPSPNGASAAPPIPTAPTPPPDFESLTGESPDDPPQQSQRGGSRPGAGRPQGMTADRAAMQHLTKTAHPPIKRGVLALGELYASATGCPAVAFADDEAEDLALPISQAMEYTGTIKYVPPWLEIGVDLLTIWFLAIKEKARVAREFKAARKPEPAGSPAGDSPTPADAPATS